jgi:hypothetical protein
MFYERELGLFIGAYLMALWDVGPQLATFASRIPRRGPRQKAAAWALGLPFPLSPFPQTERPVEVEARGPVLPARNPENGTRGKREALLASAPGVLVVPSRRIDRIGRTEGGGGSGAARETRGAPKALPRNKANLFSPIRKKCAVPGLDPSTTRAWANRWLPTHLLSKS